MEESFIKTRNISYYRFFFFYSKQQKGEPVESFYGRIREHAKKCSLGDEELTLIRDIFNFIMLKIDTQKELLKETKALEIAIHMEMEAQNQQNVNQNLNTNAQSVNMVISFQAEKRTTINNGKISPATQLFPKNTNTPAFFFANYGQHWSHNQRQIYPKKCKNCGV